MSVRDVGTAQGVALARDGHRVIDVREAAEWEAGHVSGATLLPLGELAERIENVVPERDTPLLVHCAVGERSALAAAWLEANGYRQVANLRAPIETWSAHGGGWEAPNEGPEAADRRRYARQMTLAEVGPGGQRALREASVMVVGAGGLGSPVALYLAAAGVGRIGIVDDDLVEESNLHRQVLHGAGDVGTRKVDSAERSVTAINPAVEVVKHPVRLTEGNAGRLIDGYDVVVDGSDNLETRYALNDAAVASRTAVVHGSVYRWEGHVTTFVPFEGPCYRCLYPNRPPSELAPDCSTIGVLGVLPGLVGMIQATEVMKLILGVGQTLAGRLLVVDLMGATFDEIRIARDPSCPTCGTLAVERPEGAQPATA